MSNSTLTLYVVGPGVGESVVVKMPDGRVVVVDSCERDDVNLPAVLLADLGVAQIDLLVVTHPDLDHIKGITELVERFSPKRVWRYPFGLLREILQQLGEVQTPAGKLRYAEALRSSDTLDDLLRTEGTVERVHPGRQWHPPGSDYSICALAPTQYDIARAMSRVQGLVVRKRGRLVLSDTARAWFSGERALGDLPNMVSLGLVIEWNGLKVLLAGDVENGDGTTHSGWQGVLAGLDQPDEGRSHLVNDVDVVKIAHHGSTGALYDAAWNRHATSKKTVGLATTYSPTPLPDDPVLRSLRRWVGRLGIATDAGDSFDRALAAGWVVADAGAAATLPLGPCVKVELRSDGTMSFEHGDEAGWFQ